MKRFAIIFCCFLLFCSNFAIGCGTDKNSGEPAACTISIDCRTVLDNMDELKETKKEFIPNDGWILSSTSVKFTTGETVFDILRTFVKRIEYKFLPDTRLCITTIMLKESISSMNSTVAKSQGGCIV